jgi:cytochrome P450
LSLTLSLTANLTKKVHKTLALPNGVVLPAGTIFEVAIQAANLHNPSLESPNEWQGFRFHEMRQLESPSDNITTARQYQYEWGFSTRSDLDFGYGAHACPGRAVGCNMLKIFLVLLLEKFDVRPEEGVGMGERYADLWVGQYVSDSNGTRGLGWRWC